MNRSALAVVLAGAAWSARSSCDIGSQAPAATEPRRAVENYLARLAKTAPIAGLAGFSSTSTLTFPSDPKDLHELTATYVFPDRVRWYFTRRSAEPGQRIIQYRCAETFFTLDEGSGTSSVVEPTNAPDSDWPGMCWALEMRRALFLYPDGFTWSGDNSTRTAPTACGVNLAVRLGADGRPSAMFLEGQENVHETYTNIRWRDRNGRAWPASMDFTDDNAPVWSETVDSIETSVHLLDEFFLPPDRRGFDAGSQKIGGVRSSDAPAFVVKRLEWKEKLDWKAAGERARDFTAGELPGLLALGWTAEPGTCFEVSDDGSPIRFLLRLRPAPLELPAGWEFQRESTALYAVLTDVSAGVPSAIRSLVTSAPKSARPGVPMVRFAGSPAAGGQVQVILPLLAPP